MGVNWTIRLLPDDGLVVEDESPKAAPKQQSRHHREKLHTMPLQPLRLDEIRSDPDFRAYPGWKLRRRYDKVLRFSPEIGNAPKPPSSSAKSDLWSDNEKLRQWFIEHNVEVLTPPQPQDA